MLFTSVSVCVCMQVCVCACAHTCTLSLSRIKVAMHYKHLYMHLQGEHAKHCILVVLKSSRAVDSIFKPKLASNKCMQGGGGVRVCMHADTPIYTRMTCNYTHTHTHSYLGVAMRMCRESMPNTVSLAVL